MADSMIADKKELHYEEIEAKSMSGLPALILNIILMIASVVGITMV